MMESKSTFPGLPGWYLVVNDSGDPEVVKVEPSNFVFREGDDRAYAHIDFANWVGPFLTPPNSMQLQLYVVRLSRRRAQARAAPATTE